MTEGSLITEVRAVEPGQRHRPQGDVTASAETALADAYTRASGKFTRTIVLNFSGLEYMNSGGIGMLVTLLVRANRQRQRLVAFGLNEHYRQIFELTRLDEAITLDTDIERRGRRALTARPDKEPTMATEPRDAAYWAKNVTTLKLGEVLAEAVNLNVTGRRVVGRSRASAR